MKKPTRLTVTLFGACAVIWTLRAILEIAHQTWNDSVLFFSLNLLCALLWDIVFIRIMIKYRTAADE